MTHPGDTAGTAVTPASAPGPVSTHFDADEPVFAAHPDWLGEVNGPCFGDKVWAATELRRPANKAACVWTLRFPDEDPVWNLRLREVAFCLLNPHHRVLRRAGVFPATRPAQFMTVHNTCHQLSLLARWAVTSGRSVDLRCWDSADFDVFREHRAGLVGPSSVTNAVTAIRHLIGLAPVLTHGGPAQDPWPGRSAQQIGRRPPRSDLATPSIPPQTWWPLLHAAWTYIHVFAGDLLDMRDRITRPAPADTAAAPRPGSHAVGRDYDQALRVWLADPANLIPVRGRGHSRNGAAGSVLWGSLARMVFGPDSTNPFNFGGQAALRRRALVESAAAGRTRTAGHQTDPTTAALPGPEFATITRPDGTQAPWRARISRQELGQELRMLRAACYVFTVALSMMRDSEIQEIQRGALTTHYGSPAVISRKIKHDPATPEARWWIIEPVAQAIAVAERLSGHPTHLFADLRSPGSSTRGRRGGDPGIDAGTAIDRFIGHVNTHHQLTGLAPIPASRVRPHMFRTTMAILTGNEPDAEIALGLQLKHAARRALANRTTTGYYTVDENWIAEFDTHLETAAARKLVDLLNRRRRGDTVAVGPGATRLHTGLDNALARLDNQPGLRAHHADSRTEVTLLRDEFADLHFGTINHCIFDPQQAACQNALPAEQRGHTPLLGACQPARCRNSVITDTHAPLWLAEEADLTRMLAGRRLAPPRREALQARLADVQLITRALPQRDEI